MTDALRTLLPLVLVFTGIGVGLIVLSAALSWRRWPDPQSYRTKWGVLVRRK